MIGQLARIEGKIDNLMQVITEMREEIEDLKVIKEEMKDLKEIKEEIKDLKEIKEAQKSHIFLAVSIF